MYRGHVGSSMYSFKVTKMMRKKASPDNYELTEEEREKIRQHNLNNHKLSEKIRQKYQRKIEKDPK